MRLFRPLAALAVLLALATGAQAKFGISKTKVTLKRTRPPEIILLGDTVTVEVTGKARAVTDRQLDSIRQRVEDAISADASKRLVPRGGDSLVHVSVDDFEARVNDNVTYETKYVKIGERQEWDDKKNRNVTKDVYGNRNEPVRVRTARGRIGAHVEATTPSGPRTADAGASYQDEFKGEVRIPEPASSESSLEHYLVERAGEHAAATVTFSPDPVEALLAVDGDLKDGNRLAQAGLWKEALGNWVDRKPSKGDKEAARDAQHRGRPRGARLRPARRRPRASRRAGPGPGLLQEGARPGSRRKVLHGADAADRREPAVRGQRAALHGRDAQVPRGPREARGARTARRQETEPDAPPQRRRPPLRPPLRPRPGHALPRRPARTPPHPRPRRPRTSPRRTASPRPRASPCRCATARSNPGSSRGRSRARAWSPRKRARGRVFQAVSSSAATTLVQPIGVDVQTAPGATLSLDYKVAGGEGRVRVLVAYDDAAGKPRTSTLEVTAGDPPGDWTPWTGDLVALRPRAARLKEIRIVTEGGTVLLDNVALTVR